MTPIIMSLPVKICIFLIMVTMVGSFSTGLVLGEMINASNQDHGGKSAGHDFIGGKGADDMNLLILLLKDLGLNISYGDSGETVFTMVDTSMTRIITDLSAGSSEGFVEVPLIRETMNYLDLTPADIIVNPDEVTGSMPAIDSYTARYGHLENAT